jgi:hypothetical protein
MIDGSKDTIKEDEMIDGSKDTIKEDDTIVVGR